MNYWLHPEAREDLREVAEFYRDNAGVPLAQSVLAEFEHSVGLLLEYPRLGRKWRYGKRRFVMKHFPFSIIYTVVDDQLRILASRAPQPASQLLARTEVA